MTIVKSGFLVTKTGEKKKNCGPRLASSLISLVLLLKVWLYFIKFLNKIQFMDNSIEQTTKFFKK